MMKVPEQYRARVGHFASSEADGNNGCFAIPFKSFIFMVIASDGMGWEHVSVSLGHRCPNWSEMCFIKSLFWEDEDCVIQYHPPKSEYVNMHPNTLHLWKPVGKQIETPPSILVGYK